MIHGASRLEALAEERSILELHYHALCRISAEVDHLLWIVVVRAVLHKDRCQELAQQQPVDGSRDDPLEPVVEPFVRRLAGRGLRRDQVEHAGQAGELVLRAVARGVDAHGGEPEARQGAGETEGLELGARVAVVVKDHGKRLVVLRIPARDHIIGVPGETVGPPPGHDDPEGHIIDIHQGFTGLPVHMEDLFFTRNEIGRAVAPDDEIVGK